MFMVNVTVRSATFNPDLNLLGTAVSICLTFILFKWHQYILFSLQYQTYGNLFGNSYYYSSVWCRWWSLLNSRLLLTKTIVKTIKKLYIYISVITELLQTLHCLYTAISHVYECDIAHMYTHMYEYNNGI